MSFESTYVIATVASTSYPAASAAQLPDVGAPGYVTATHLGVLGNPDVILSFDGVTDHVLLRAGTALSTMQSQVPQYRAVWARLSGAGSVDVHLAIEREGRR